MATLSQRFAGKFIPEPNSGCWLWEGSLSPAGYGQIHVNGRTETAHRVSYELTCGPVGDGLWIDHLCRNRACVNPNHLEAVSPGENTRRGLGPKRQTDKTHCPQGHPYSGKNLYVPPSGGRYCRACISARTVAWQRRRRAG